MSFAYAYTTPPNPNLVCCICHSPFLNPVTTLTCAHTFCQDCILQALDHASVCPIDRIPLTKSQFRRTGGIVESLVDELVVACPHADSGCETTTQRQSMAHHLMEECPWSEMGCTVSGCGERMKRKEYSVHRRDIHGMDSTTNEEVPDEVGEGVAEISGSGPSKVTLLTEQNILLVHRVSTLEATVRELKREMESVKGVLGPWLRSNVTSERQTGAETGADQDGQVAGSSALQHPEPSIDNDMSSGVGLSSELPVGPLTSLQPVNNDDERDTFASYFPDVGSGDGSYSNNSSAPTLESTLSDLESSSKKTDLTLASLETTARRNEITISNIVNESLRMGEEIVGLRAGMYGLRMQMAGILMERDRMMMRPGAIPHPHPTTTTAITDDSTAVHRFGAVTKL